MLKILTPLKIKSQNEFSNKRGYGAQFAYSQNKQLWHKDIHFLTSTEEGRAERQDQRRKTVVIFSMRTRLLDKGNLIGGCKAILDVLVEEGLLVDDSPEWLDDYYYQAKVKSGKECTEIFVF